MRFLIVSLTLAALFLSGCGSKLDRAKNAYAKGEYFKAQQMLEALIQVEPTAEVEKYLNLSKAGNNFINADSCIKKDSLLAVWKAFNNAGNYDTISQLFKTIGEKLANATINEIETKDMPGKNWEAAVAKCDNLLKYGIQPAASNQAKAQALSGREKRLSLGAITCWQNVLNADPKNEKARTALQKLEKMEKPYTEGFKKFQESLVRKNFAQWKAMLSKDCLALMEDNLKKSQKAGNKEFKSLKDYFEKVTIMDPINEKSSTGAYVVAFEELSPSTAAIYYAYPRWKLCNRVVAEMKDGGAKFGCEEGSEIKNTEKK
jgi:hypothetical protein